MADQPAGERTEQPTEERLQRTREEGKVPQSAEVPSALLLALLLVTAAITAGKLYGWMCQEMIGGLSFRMPGRFDSQTLMNLLQDKANSLLGALAPFLIVAAVASVLGSVAVGGFAFAPKAIKFDFSRIASGNGLKQLFSMRSVMMLLINVAKMTVLVLVAWSFIGDNMDRFVALRYAEPEGTMVATAQFMMGAVIRVVLAVVAIAGVNFVYQKWSYKHGLRMTQQEVKDERKQHESSPQIKARIRRIQIEMARRRMMKDVPTADVVLANPTHYAVALKYDSKTMSAPLVVAKGPDAVAQKIKELARAHGVPIVTKPELARALYAASEVGESVPGTLFVAVAEVLAMIYRLRKKGIAPQ